MPANKVITRDVIVEKAILFLEERGEAALNARALACFIGCSTQPLYLAFSGMEQLKICLRERCEAVFGSYVAKEQEDTLFMKNAMAYLRFSLEKPNLFRFLFRDSPVSALSENEAYRKNIVRQIEFIAGYSPEDAERFYVSAWIYMHGLAGILLTNPHLWDMAEARRLLSEHFAAMKQYFGGKTHV